MGAVCAECLSKAIRKRFSQQYLDRFYTDSTNFVRWFVSMDETWVHHYTPETKQKSNPVVQHSRKWLAGKLKFWDVKEILLIDFLAKSRTITGEYYLKLLDELDAGIRERQPEFQKEKIFLRITCLLIKVVWRWENNGISGTICRVIPLFSGLGTLRLPLFKNLKNWFFGSSLRPMKKLRGS
ncbi:putative DD34D transposase [Trichonephila clavipes]|nr:putative DD34D transposase [Trichonephila clavipes]